MTCRPIPQWCGNDLFRLSTTACVARSGLASRSTNPAAPDEAPDPVLVEHEFGDGAGDIHVAHQGQCTVVQNEPPAIDASRDFGVIFVWHAIPHDDDFHVIFR